MANKITSKYSYLLAIPILKNYEQPIALVYKLLSFLIFYF